MTDAEVNVKKPRRWRNIILVIVGIPVLCVCLLLAMGIYRASTPEGQAEATEQAQERATAVVLSTAEAAEEMTRVDLEAGTVTAEAVAAGTTQAIAGATEAARPTDTPIPTATTEPTATPNLAPPFSEIAEQYNTLTEAQWDVYSEALIDSYAEGWTGTVTEVEEGGLLSDGYTVIVDAGRDSAFSEVYIREVPEDVALSLNRQQPITFSGTIRSTDRFISLGIYIYDATIVAEDG